MWFGSNDAADEIWTGPPPPVELEVLQSRAGKLRPYLDQIDRAASAEYGRRNAKDAASFEHGLLAVRLFVCHAVTNDPYGEGMLFKACDYALLAEQAGGKDPIFSAIHHVLRYSTGATRRPDVLSRDQEVIASLRTSGYPVLLKFPHTCTAIRNLVWAGDNPPDATIKQLAAALPTTFAVAAAQLGELVKSRAPDDVVYRFSERLIEAGGRDPNAVQKAWAGVQQAFATGAGSPSTLAALQGSYFVEMAWASRGSGWASSVTEEGWRLMAQRLAAAEGVLTTAINRYPNDWRLPVEMLTVELGQGRGRQRMEQFFQAAVRIDPGCYSAYSKKMYYLQPRWHGSVEDVVEFGEKCLQTGRWADRIPMVFPEGVAMLTVNVPRIYRAEQVWKTISGIYREMLKRYPDSTRYRTQFALCAKEAGRWDVVREQMALLGRYWDRHEMSGREHKGITDALKVPALFDFAIGPVSDALALIPKPKDE